MSVASNMSVAILWEIPSNMTQKLLQDSHINNYIDKRIERKHIGCLQRVILQVNVICWRLLRLYGENVI